MSSAFLGIDRKAKVSQQESKKIRKFIDTALAAVGVYKRY